MAEIIPRSVQAFDPARAGYFDAFAPTQGPVLVLTDWTDVPSGKLLVFALPCNGRSVPFWVNVVPKDVLEGGLIQAENDALYALQDICRNRSGVILVADRGFGNKRWLQAAHARGGALSNGYRASSTSTPNATSVG